MNAVYFDNAATSFPKPREVAQAVARAINSAGGNPGRGAHSLSLAAAREVYACREAVCSLLGCADPARVVFTCNATHALNIAIKSMIPPGSAVAVSALEHNSVVRPLTAAGCRIITFDPLRDADAVTDGAAFAISRGARAVVCAHASNVLPVALPVARIAALCRAQGAVCIIDAAQSAGVLDIDADAWGADAVCFPGHKGLLGPAGCGGVIFSAGRAQNAAALSSVIEGGSGVDSASAGMPRALPERFEAGTPAVPAIAGLAAGIGEVKRIGVEVIRRGEERLAARLRETLGNTPGVTLYDAAVTAAGAAVAGGLVLFNVNGVPCEETAARLDAAGFCVRAGLHCSPYAHRRIGTAPGGAVRFSPGIYSAARDADRFALAVRDIVREKR